MSQTINKITFESPYQLIIAVKAFFCVWLRVRAFALSSNWFISLLPSLLIVHANYFNGHHLITVENKRKWI